MAGAEWMFRRSSDVRLPRPRQQVMNKVIAAQEAMAETARLQNVGEVGHRRASASLVGL